MQMGVQGHFSDSGEDVSTNSGTSSARLEQRKSTNLFITDI